MTVAEQEAREAIFARFVDLAEGGQAPTLEEAATIASAHGIYPADAFAEEQCREAVLIYIGACWGVGPKATRYDRLRAWWRCRRSAVSRQAEEGSHA